MHLLGQTGRVDEEVKNPELPFEIDVGRIAFIHQDCWDNNPNATKEAKDVALWLDFQVERRIVGETIPAKPVQRLTLTVEECCRLGSWKHGQDKEAKAASTTEEFT